MRNLTIPERLFFALLGGWLLAAALWVDLEYYDGLDSVVNARFHTGQTREYAATRGPLMGFLLIPAEAVRSGFGLHPLDTRPHHVLMALLQFAGIALTWRALRRRFDDAPAVLLACAATLPVFLFFSYAPFISHDILPGFLLLGMLLAADDWRRDGRASSWGWVTALGAAAAMIKFTFGLFWVAVLATQAVAVVLDRDRELRERLTRLLVLGFGAVAGAAACWLLMCACLGTIFPDTPFLERAALQLKYLSSYAHDASRPEPPWVYLRNLPAFGPLAMLLVLPGLWFSLRGTRLQQSAALSWILLVAAFHITPLRQVRYLAFLAPVTALVILPVLLRLRRNRIAWAAALLLLAANWIPRLPYNCFGESTRLFRERFYGHSPLREFLDPLLIPKKEMNARFPFFHDSLPRSPVLVNWRMLSFMPDRDTPLRGDKYHDLFHFGSHHLAALYGYEAGSVISFEGTTLPPVIQATRWPDHAAAVLAHPAGAIAINPTTGPRGPADHRGRLRTYLLAPAGVPFRLDASLSAADPAGRGIRAETVRQGDTSRVVFSGEGIQALCRRRFDAIHLEVNALPGPQALEPMKPLAASLTGDGRIVVHGLALGQPGDGFSPMAFRFFEVIREHAE